MALVAAGLTALLALTDTSETDWVFPTPAASPEAARAVAMTPPAPTASPQAGSAAPPLPTSEPDIMVPSPAPPDDGLVLAHYMVWFKTPDYSGKWQKWDWDPDGDGGEDAQDHLPGRLRPDGNPDLATPYQPLIGPYDSSDPAAIEYQLALAWASGIDGFVVDWYGPQDNGHTDRALALTFDVVERWRTEYGFRFFMAVTYEEQLLLQLDNDRQREETATTHLSYILNNYTAKDSYLRYQSSPLIFYFEAWPDGSAGLLRPDQLAQIQAGLPPFYLLYMGAETDFMDVSQGFYSWLSGANDNPADWGQDYADWVYGEMDYRSEKHDLKINIGSVWAGFDDSMVWGWGQSPRFIDRQDGQVYAQTWDRALRDQAQRNRQSPAWVQIVTWNDWNEGSQIEPALEYGNYYLETTQQYAARYSGRQMLSPAALKIPPAIYFARQNRPGPATEAVITEAYRYFFAGQFDAALAVLERAGFAE